MIAELTALIQPIVQEYGVWGVFLATLLEEIIAPIPSPLVPLAAGFFLLPAEKTLSEIWLKALLVVAFPVSVGITLGSLAVYSIGYFGGKPAIEKSRRWLGFGWQDIERAEKRLMYSRYDEIALFALRLMPIVPGVAISGFCGIVRYPVKTFALITLFGAFARAFFLGIIGWYVGGIYAVWAEAISRTEKYIFIVLIAIAAFFIAKAYFKKRRRPKI
jgi:membrane protein DedA with SNARE-associated domain